MGSMLQGVSLREDGVEYVDLRVTQAGLRFRVEGLGLIVVEGLGFRVVVHLAI